MAHFLKKYVSTSFLSWLFTRMKIKYNACNLCSTLVNMPVKYQSKFFKCFIRAFSFFNYNFSISTMMLENNF